MSKGTKPKFLPMWAQVCITITQDFCFFFFLPHPRSELKVNYLLLINRRWAGRGQLRRRRGSTYWDQRDLVIVERPDVNTIPLLQALAASNCTHFHQPLEPCPIGMKSLHIPHFKKSASKAKKWFGRSCASNFHFPLFPTNPRCFLLTSSASNDLYAPW